MLIVQRNGRGYDGGHGDSGEAFECAPRHQPSSGMPHSPLSSPRTQRVIADPRVVFDGDRQSFRFACELEEDMKQSYEGYAISHKHN